MTHESQLVCSQCGTVVDSSNIVSEVAFGETSTGQAVVQGSHIGDGQRFAHTMGAGAPRGALGQGDSREMAIKAGKFNKSNSFSSVYPQQLRSNIQAGREEIYRLADKLGITAQRDHAVGLYQLASTGSFTQGRNTRAVAAVCLYFCCRTRQEENRVLLMDFAELIKVNVFRLGDTYKEFCKKMYLNENAIDKNNKPKIPPVEIEPLIKRFCAKLEFGRDLKKVAEDAARILGRFDRDWMVTGRRPSGLVGACIILAGRMNNYRRSVREVVYVVRATDATIIKRLEEFKRTKSSRQTVEQFRNGGHALREEHDPPSILYSKERREKLENKRKRKRAQLSGEESQALEDSASRQPSTVPAQSTQEHERDADGFLVPRRPQVPIDPRLDHQSGTASAEPEGQEDGGESEAAAPPKRKRRRKEKPQPIEISRAELAFERQLTKEIEKIIHDRIELDEFKFDAARVRADAQGEAERALERAKRAEQARDGAAEPSSSTTVQVDYDSELIDPSEFADDPEVQNCELTEAERRVKEAIWLTHNEDWLRAQQKRLLDRTMEEARNGGVKKKQTRRKMGRIGDGKIMEDGSPAKTPAEAVLKVLDKRAPKFSRNVNYESMAALYNVPGESTSTSGEETSEESPLGKERAASVETGASEVSEMELDMEKLLEHADDAAAAAGTMVGALPTPQTTQQQDSQAPTAPATQQDPINISDDEEEEEEEDEDDEDEEARDALHGIGDHTGAIGYGSPHAEDEDMPDYPEDVYEGEE